MRYEGFEGPVEELILLKIIQKTGMGRLTGAAVLPQGRNG